MTTDTIEAPAAEPKAKPKPKPAIVDTITGFCRYTPTDDAMHLHCKGSGSNGAGSTWFCQCDCHVEHPTCRDCGSRDVEVTLEGTCVDVDGCQTTQTIRRAENPVHRQLLAILADAEAREAEAALRRKAEREAARAREAAQAEREGRPVPPAARPARTPKAAPTPQRCHCGCAGMTKGGKFVAGHDARLKGMLVRAARQTKPESGSAATKAQAIRAMAELIARDWPRKGVDAKITQQADALVDQYGPDTLIDTAVAQRYAGQEA